MKWAFVKRKFRMITKSVFCTTDEISWPKSDKKLKLNGLHRDHPLAWAISHPAKVEDKKW